MSRKILTRFVFPGIIISIVVVAIFFAAQYLLTRRQSTPDANVSPSIASQLQECLPKSDAGSKEKCDKLMAAIQTYDQCVEAGFPIQESYPEKCATADGRTFVSNVPTTISISGSVICLPHRDTSGPTTLECAFGIKDSEGKNYALSTNKLPQGEFIDMSAYKTLTVEGMFVPLEQISINTWQKYDIVGIIEIESYIGN